MFIGWIYLTNCLIIILIGSLVLDTLVLLVLVLGGFFKKKNVNNEIFKIFIQKSTCYISNKQIPFPFPPNVKHYKWT